MMDADSGMLWIRGLDALDSSRREYFLEVEVMDAHDEEALIPQARLDDLDFDSDADAATWEARLTGLADHRIQQVRSRLERMGITDREGNLIPGEVPADMLPGSETSVVTGENVARPLILG